MACGGFVKRFPDECKDVLPRLTSLWFEAVSDNIWSVRENAALALGDAIDAYPSSMADVVACQLKTMLLEHKLQGVNEGTNRLDSADIDALSNTNGQAALTKQIPQPVRTPAPVSLHQFIQVCDSDQQVVVPAAPADETPISPIKSKIEIAVQHPAVARGATATTGDLGSLRNPRGWGLGHDDDMSHENQQMLARHGHKAFDLYRSVCIGFAYVRKIPGLC